MRISPRVLFWLIIALTILSVSIDLPKTINISYDSPKLPVINKKISIHRNIQGFNPNFFLGPFRIQKEFEFKKGLDLEGGTSITLKADMKGVQSTQRKNALESAKTVIEKRVNFFGVSEPVIQTSTVNDDYRIIIELPGVSDVNQAVKLIGTTAQLSFWEDGASQSAKLASPSAFPAGITSLFSNPKKTGLTGSDLQQTNVSFDQNTGKPQVQLAFTTNGSKKFADITKRNVGKAVVIVLDNQIIEAPRVNEPIINGSAVITGSFTTDQAKALTIQLNAGALPVPLSVLGQHAIGPTLGISSLQKSLFAGLLGLIIIVVFMTVLYGGLGVIASLALILYAIFVLAIFKFIPVTLTLAGIAGFILSIGMAVDANILIFERKKEEERLGKTKDVAIELGFSRAWSSIRDSNISSLITSAILYKFGTGPVRGFALTLAIGVLISMFSAIVVTRTFLRLIYRKAYK
ncbi:MAG: protein translocase subunit SecD [Candidatus Levybacteria bacterium]|nr:protein translocase subunit SecD [Candidatus Levybacteria bacterium]